jgi:hypothetical protein
MRAAARAGARPASEDLPAGAGDAVEARWLLLVIHGRTMPRLPWVGATSAPLRRASYLSIPVQTRVSAGPVSDGWHIFAITGR